MSYSLSGRSTHAERASTLLAALRERAVQHSLAGVSDDSGTASPQPQQADTPWLRWLSTLVPAMFPSDAALAREVGVHPSQVTRWRRGSRPRLEVLYGLARATGVSPEYLFSIIGFRPSDLPQPPRPRRLDLPPVVAAVVVSGRGVLLGRRRDGEPPWTFIAGEQEPGEQPEDTAVREVKEETGCEIRTRQIIGERVHPRSGRRMIYMAAAPASGTDVIVGDEAELTEVRWATFEEAIELLPGMFTPVWMFLWQAIGPLGGAK